MSKVLGDFSLVDFNSVGKSEISKPCQIREGISMRTVGHPAAIRLLESSTLTNKNSTTSFSNFSQIRRAVQHTEKFLSIQVSHRVVEITRNSLKILELLIEIR
jgi:hypothetical protein